VGHAMTLDSQQAAVELYQILQELDPSRWRAELEQTIRPRLSALHQRIRDLSAKADSPALISVRERLADLAHLLEQTIPTPDLTHAQRRWDDFRLKVSPAYEQLAASLAHLDIHVPSLRPTNYARNLFHVGNAVFCLVLLQVILNEWTAIVVTISVASAAWTLEISRRFMPGLNSLLMKIFSPIAHPHEAWRINSATWYTTALVFLALIQDLSIASTAIIVLGLADPAAAIIGRRFGTVKLIHGRSLEGTSTFVAVGTIAAFTWLMVAYDFSPSTALTWAIAGTIPGAIAELFSRRIDDNLSIPVSVATGLLLTRAVLGG